MKGAFPIEGQAMGIPFHEIKVEEELPPPTKAPTVGEHTEEVLTELLGYDKEKIAKLRERTRRRASRGDGTPAAGSA